MRTTIKITAANEVTLSAIDPATDEQVTRVFWIPMSGGYVREGAGHSGSDRQVCDGLAFRGATLSADTVENLLKLIRSEWAAYRKQAAQF